MSAYGAELAALGVKPLSGSLNPETSFAFVTLRDRLPVIITQLVDTLSRLLHGTPPLALQDQPPARLSQWAGQLQGIIAALSRLRYEMQCNKAVLELDTDAGHCATTELWNAQIRQWRDQNPPLCGWFDVPWLFAECYLYCRVAGLFQQPHLDPWWRDYDWFAEQKARSLTGSIAEMSAVGQRLNQVISSDNCVPSLADFTEFLHCSLWGNQVDLSMNADRSAEQVDMARHASHVDAAKEFLLVDDTRRVYSHLINASATSTGDAVHIILDNAGAELFMDLCLADWLLSRGLCSQVVLHMKCHPWFVSDTTASDVELLLTALDSSEMGFNGLNAAFDARSLAQRWRQRIACGQWVFKQHEFWTSFLPYWKLRDCEPELHASIMSNARLVIFKGDLNYRKLVHDGAWPSDTQFSTAIGPLADLTHNAPILALRTLKADVVVGLRPGQASLLDAKYGKQAGVNGWMVSGRFAVIQSSLPVNSAATGFMENSAVVDTSLEINRH